MSLLHLLCQEEEEEELPAAVGDQHSRGRCPQETGIGVFFWPAQPRWLSPSYFWRRMCKGILLSAAGAASKPAKHHPAPAAAGISGHIWPLDIATPTAIDKLRDSEVGFVRQPIEKYR